MMRVTETAHWLEWQDWADPILKKPFAVNDSHLEIQRLPGVGIEWDEDAVERYSYETEPAAEREHEGSLIQRTVRR